MTEQLIGIAQMRISEDPNEILVAPNLGSCIGLAVYDPQSHRGGMIHCLLPLSKSDPAKALANPCMYVDTGVAKLLETIAATTRDLKKLRIVAAGGANINDDQKLFEIGKKNFTVLRKILWKNNLLLSAEHFGESSSRTISLNIGTGVTLLKINGQIIEL